MTRILRLACRNMTISILHMAVTKCLCKHHLRPNPATRQSDQFTYRPHFPRAPQHLDFGKVALDMLVGIQRRSQLLSLTTVLSCQAAFLLLARTLRSTVPARSTLKEPQLLLHTTARVQKVSPQWSGGCESPTPRARPTSEPSNVCCFVCFVFRAFSCVFAPTPDINPWTVWALRRLIPSCSALYALCADI